ncbi:Hypothetical predicted protein [Cloeon dipterum]|uniref:Uncharacterized protein n=1 Tax=Cloeon dipterum TaxID=197152 RepID=A0A8S1DWL1_9INSE|nr:Hypothetical predicted protein [Cloeon dipterum]
MDTETEQQVYAVELVRKMGELPAVILLEEERKEWHDSISQIHRIYNVQASAWLLWKLYSFERDKLPAIITYEKARECCCFSEADDYLLFVNQFTSKANQLTMTLMKSKLESQAILLVYTGRIAIMTRETKSLLLISPPKKP